MKKEATLRPKEIPEKSKNKLRALERSTIKGNNKSNNSTIHTTVRNNSPRAPQYSSTTLRPTLTYLSHYEALHPYQAFTNHTHSTQQLDNQLHPSSFIYSKKTSSTAFRITQPPTATIWNLLIFLSYSLSLLLICFFYL